MAYNDVASEHSKREKVKLLGYMIGAAMFFGVIMLISFFVVIMAINVIKIPVDIAPNILLVGLVPPSVATFLLFTKVLGRFT
ncbi:MAG: hypothetical protein M3278_05870 [Thermoproteota archaeon]|nr:hypothetical protein [Thermoproteota archaeon]